MKSVAHRSLSQFIYCLFVGLSVFSSPSQSLNSAHCKSIRIKYKRNDDDGDDNDDNNNNKNNGNKCGAVAA